MQAFFSTSKGLESSLNLCKPVLVQRMSDNAVSTLLEVFWSSCTAQKQACTIFTGPSHRSKQFCRSYLVLKHACTSFIGPPTRLEWLYWTFSTLKQALYMTSIPRDYKGVATHCILLGVHVSSQLFVHPLRLQLSTFHMCTYSIKKTGSPICACHRLSGSIVTVGSNLTQGGVIHF